MKTLYIILFLVHALLYWAEGRTSNWTIIERVTNPPHFSPLPPTTPPVGTTTPEDAVFDPEIIPIEIRERYIAEAEMTARKAIDRGSRPKVYFQMKADLTSTNEWETILMIEPWRLAENYRVIIK